MVLKQEGHSGPESLTCTMCTNHVQWKDNDLNHFVEGNTAGLFVCITRPYPLPPHHTQKFSIYQILSLSPCGFRQEDFFMFSLDGPLRNMARQADFVPKGLNFIILGRSQLGDVLPSLNIILYKTFDPGAGPFLTPG